MTYNTQLTRFRREATNTDYVRIEFDQTGGRGRACVRIPLGDFHVDGRLQAALANGGMAIPDDKKEKAAMFGELRSDLPEQAGTIYATTGWKEGFTAFMLPSGLISAADSPPIGPVELDGNAAERCTAKGTQGTLDEWKKHVGAPARGSTYAGIAVLTSLAAPLFALSGLEEGFIVNLAGNSSSGKSTANRIAASVWGRPDGLPSWNSSERALFELAAAHSDICLVVDDTERGTGRVAARLEHLERMVHTLTSGESRSYAKTVSGAEQLPLLRFNCLALSSSPKALEDYCRETDRPRTDGDRARLLELRVPHGDIGGIWEGHSFSKEKHVSGSREASDLMNEQVRKFYGVAGQAWIKYLVGREDLAGQVKSRQNKFLQQLDREMGSVEGRIAAKLGLLYAAGAIAIKAGVLPWKREKVLEISNRALRIILDTAFSPSPAEVQGLVKLRDALSVTENFPVVESGSPMAEVLRRDGFIMPRKNRIYVISASFDEIVQPEGASYQDGKAVVAMLRQRLSRAGALLAGHGTGSTQDIRIDGKKHPYLAFDAAALNGVFEDLCP